MNGEKQETEFGNRNWKVAGIVAVFGAGLIVSGVLRFYNLHAENPPQLTAYSTVIYIGVTIIAAVLLSRAGLPMKRLGFGPTFRPAKVPCLGGDRCRVDTVVRLVSSIPSRNASSARHVI